MTVIENQDTFTFEDMKSIMTYVGKEVIANKSYLTELDSAIGDGDHGIGMEVGFKNGLKAFEEKELSSINDVFLELGKAMINNMGGASGVIFGTFFVAGFKGKEAQQELSLAQLTDVFEKGLEAVKKRGKASVGDKTVIDALEPAVNALKKAIEENLSSVEAFQLASNEALKGVESTKILVAKFGRAKSLGERALGHQDAGATTVYIIFKSIAQWLNNKEVSNG